MGSDSARKVWSATAENNIQGHFGFQDTSFLTSVALPRRKSSEGVSIFEKLKRVWRDKEQKSALKKIKQRRIFTINREDKRWKNRSE